MNHLSAFDLDALALGAVAPEADAHLGTCARCRADQEAAAALRDHFDRYVARVPSRPRRSWWWLALPAVAALIAVIAMPRHHEPTLGIKGGATWRVLAKRNAETFVVTDGQELAPNDRIRFVVTANGAKYLLVVSIDGAGNASIYYPYDGSESGEVIGDRFELPGSIVLDAAPGPERVFAILTDEPLAADVAKQRLRALGARGNAAIRATSQLELAARAQLTLLFEKAAP